MRGSNYKIGDKMSSAELSQTDFGRIYYNLPKEIREPSTIEELAQILKNYHKRGTAVTIRNTGHSSNGQTLTDGVQIDLGRIRGVRFDEEQLEATVGAGTSWHELFQAINLPKYCAPVFPNNPGQKIHIGGTAAVGGIGPYSTKYGGFWNHVLRLKLVTMTGEIIECSREQNYELLQYSLGGFGRIGVIGELTMRVIPATKEVLALALVYHDRKKLYDDTLAALRDPQFDCVMPQLQLAKHPTLQKLGLNPGGLFLLIDLGENANVKELTDYVTSKFHEDLTLFIQDNAEGESYDLGVTWKHATMLKTDIVYAYADPRNENPKTLDASKPWIDCIVDPIQLYNFWQEETKIVHAYGMQGYVTKEQVFHDPFNIDTFTSWSIKKLTPQGEPILPLSLDLPQAANFAFGVGILLTVPSNKVNAVLKMIKAIDDLTYEIQGKRYLHGTHNLTKAQIEQHFGRQVIEHWQQIKDELDPKHLLNIGVIEHLDGEGWEI